MQKQKKGISLIVLVITIIVMIILATAVIITLSSTKIITKAREAVLKTDVKNFEQELSISLADKKLADGSLSFTDVNATTLEEIKEYIPDFNKKYAGKIFIQNGELVYDNNKVTEDEQAALESMGIKSGKIYTPAEIKAIIDSKNLGTDVSTTDVTTYVEGLTKKEAEKYTIYQGNIYYRYDKTTFEERKQLYAAEFPLFVGDANGNGILDKEDSEIIGYFGLTWIGSEESLLYASNIDLDFVIDGSDVYLVDLVIGGHYTYEEFIDIESQDPERLRIIGDYWKCWGITDGEVLDESVSATGYTELVRYIPKITDNYFAERVSLIGGMLRIRLDKLTDTERSILIELTEELGDRERMFIGDGNGDGYITEEDLTILDKITQAATPTDLQQIVLDINGDGTIDTSDLTLLEQYLEGSITYDNMM